MVQSMATSTQTPYDVDAAAIRQAVMEYSASWSAGDPARLERSVHPELAKRTVRPVALPVPWKLDVEHSGALRLVQETRQAGRAAEMGPRAAEVTLLDHFGNAASVKLGSAEYHHVVRWNGRWVIVNILAGLQPLPSQAPVAALTGAHPAQGETDEEAIWRTALDYIESCYAGDPARMEQSLYPDLAKRIVVPNASPAGDRLDQLSALGLVQLVRSWPSSPDARRAEVTILDRSANAASVRTDASTWIDYMHLARHQGQGRWMIVNVLWTMRPTADLS